MLDGSELPRIFYLSTLILKRVYVIIIISEEVMNNKNKTWTIIFKIFTILLFAFIIVLVCYDFFDTSKSYLTTEILIALSIALVVVCIDSFDSFQIGNILNIKRENKNLKEQNENLTKIISNINNNVYVNYAEVKQSTEEDKQIKLAKENEDCANEIDYKSMTKKESKILDEYINKNGFETATIIRDAKLDLQNPFINENIIFDLYIKQENKEQFVEIKNLVPSMYDYYYIHKQLFMISYYNRVKNTNAKYVLILKEEMINSNNRIAKLNKQKLEQMNELFKAVIDKGLMSVIIL